jgi:hypothetical protein
VVGDNAVSLVDVRFKLLYADSVEETAELGAVWTDTGRGNVARSRSAVNSSVWQL